MGKKILILFLLGFTAFSIQAQEDETYEIGGVKRTKIMDTTTAEVMVVPVNPLLYYSYFDRQMVEVNGVSPAILRDTIRLILALKVAEAFADSFTTAVLPEAKTGLAADMEFMYNAVNYAYPEVPPPPKEETTMDKVKKPFKKKDKNKKNKKTGTYIENGQIVTNPDYKEHYTNAVVQQTDLLELVHQRNKTNIFVLINKYEMTIPQVIDQTHIQSGNYPREIKVHYTLVDWQGSELHSGLIKYDASSFDNQLVHLFGQPFEYIGREILRKFVESGGSK